MRGKSNERFPPGPAARSGRIPGRRELYLGWLFNQRKEKVCFFEDKPKLIFMK